MTPKVEPPKPCADGVHRRVTASTICLDCGAKLEPPKDEAIKAMSELPLPSQAKYYPTEDIMKASKLPGQSDGVRDKIEEILNVLAAGERGWVHEELDGTSMMKENLESIDREVKTATQSILDHFTDYLNRVVPEIIGEDDDEPGVLRDEDGDPVSYEEIRTDLRAEQRKKWDEIQKGIKGEL